MCSFIVKYKTPKNTIKLSPVLNICSVTFTAGGGYGGGRGGYGGDGFNGYGGNGGKFQKSMYNSCHGFIMILAHFLRIL